MIFADRALLSDGWATGVRITVSEGRIATVTRGAAPGAGGFLFTDGHGGLGDADSVHARVGLNWDNHLVPL